jgi:hypothetical protein
MHFAFNKMLALAFVTMLFAIRPAFPQADTQVPDWFGESASAALLDETPHVSSQTVLIRSAPQVLAKVATSDSSRRNEIVTALLKILDDPAADLSISARGQAIIALSAIKQADSTQKKAIVSALIHASKNSDTGVRNESGLGLARFAVDDPIQRDDIIKTLIAFLESEQPDFNFAWIQVARALTAIHLDATQDQLFHTLLQRRLQDVADGRIGPTSAYLIDIAGLLHLTGSDQRSFVNLLNRINDLVKGSLSPVRAVTVRVLRAINPAAQEPANLLVEAAITELDQWSGAHHLDAVRVLEIVESSDANQRVVIALALMHCLANVCKDPDPVARTNTRVEAAQALGSIAPSLIVLNEEIATLLFNICQEQDPDGLVKSAAIQAIGRVKITNPDLLNSIIAVLLTTFSDAKDTMGNTRVAAITTLSQLEPINDRQRQEIIRAAIDRLADTPDPGDGDVALAIVDALARLKLPDANQRSKVRKILLNKSSDLLLSMTRDAGFLAFGPLEVKEIILLLAKQHDDATNQSAFWRARAISFAGPVKPDDDAWLILRFLGQPAPSAIPWSDVEGKRSTALRYLTTIDKYWPYFSRRGFNFPTHIIE